MSNHYPTSTELRQSITDRALALAKAMGISKTALATKFGDCAFLHGVENGRNFGIETYQRFHDFCDKQERKLSK